MTAGFHDGLYAALFVRRDIAPGFLRKFYQRQSRGCFCGKAATTGPHLVYTSVRLPAILLRTRSNEADDGVDNS